MAEQDVNKRAFALQFFVTKVEWDETRNDPTGGFLVTLELVTPKGSDATPTGEPTRQSIVVPVSHVAWQGLFTWALTSTASLCFKMEYPSSCLVGGLPE